ncbi:LAFA_0F04126g1_1 [Lachancea sp. 'fantastica']|nr:LAFA_0F04126g1_1 [Lachancea sp. 'fantastica']
MSNSYSVFVSTFNCGKVLPVDDPIELKAVLSTLLPAEKSHDIYALGFQELTPIWQGSFAEMVHKTLQIVGESAVELLNRQNGGRRFKLAALNSTGAIGLLVIVATDVSVSNILKASVKCGMFFSSLKGAAALQMRLQCNDSDVSDSFVFVTAHLAANEGENECLKREQDYHTVVGELQRELGSFRNHHVFICGDFNFRSSKWASNLDDFCNMDLVRQAVVEHDELTLGRKAERIFGSFDEAPIAFGPTYKFTLTTPDEQYNLKRTPSWCDRILFQSQQVTPEILNYTSRKRNASLQFTDHLPVILELTVPHIEFEPVVSSTLESPQEQQWTAKLTGSVVDATVGYLGLANDLYGRQLKILALILATWLLWKAFT